MWVKSQTSDRIKRAEIFILILCLLLGFALRFDLLSIFDR